MKDPKLLSHTKAISLPFHNNHHLPACYFHFQLSFIYVYWLSFLRQTLLAWHLSINLETMTVAIRTVVSI